MTYQEAKRLPAGSKVKINGVVVTVQPAESIANFLTEDGKDFACNPNTAVVEEIKAKATKEKVETKTVTVKKAGRPKKTK